MTDLVFIDTETTGLRPSWHEIIEIAAIRVRSSDLEIIEEAEAKIVPEYIERASPESLEVNGFNPEAWADQGVSFADAFGVVGPVIDGAVPAGHVVHFDLDFIEAGFARAGLNRPYFGKFGSIDTCTLARKKLHGKIGRMTLDSVCDYYGVSNKNHHTARADAWRSLEVYRRLRGDK